jgi:hypothetical protein
MGTDAVLPEAGLPSSAAYSFYIWFTTVSERHAGASGWRRPSLLVAPHRGLAGEPRSCGERKNG